MKFIDLDKTAAYRRLAEAAEAGKRFDFGKVLTGDRVKRCSVPLGEGLAFNWAAKAVDDAVLDGLQALADEQELVGKYRALLEGEIMNTGEGRKVLHQLLRSPDGKSCTGKAVPQGPAGRDLGGFYRQELERFCAFAGKVRSGEIGPAPGKRYTAFCQIGIGGSDLGPRALSIALENWAAGEGKKALRAEFISNVDPDDASKVASSLPLAETLFILVSKSGTTQETLTNELFVKDKIKKAGLDPATHMAAVTSETSPLARNPVYVDSFYFDDFIGGRYSSSSAVGGVILSLAYGGDVFRDFLAGANTADRAALEPDIRKNAALLDALSGVWERNFLGYPCTAILPYSQALSRFPAHLQQLDMESNGKRVNRDGKPVAYPTGPIVFGEPGTNGQHSFYQLLHQGTDTVPLQFIGFRESQRKDDGVIDGSTGQAKLKANLAAQITAFANGKRDADGNKEFPGGRPSSLIWGERLTPRALGALLAHYENKVMFQGFAWNLNSFDQEGVQLGKVLAKKILAKSAGSGDPVLDAYGELLGV
jgi:glucose-6-phosphate isomerase